jgi:hypothetical protein
MDQEGNAGLPPFGSSVLVQQVVAKATEPGWQTSSAIAALAALLAPFLNQLAGKIGLQVSSEEILGIEGVLFGFILNRAWAKAGIHKLAAVLAGLGLTSAASEVDSLAS